jgi:hypothetical protein
MSIREVSSMSALKAKELADEVQRLYEEEWRSPFPREDCNYLIDENSDDRFKDLCFDLDTYFAQLAGFACSTKRFLKLSADKLEELRGRIRTSFFEEYPQYALLERQIIELETPDLYERLQLCEKIRSQLLQLFSVLLDEQ